jgi:hypothetical protein
MNIGLHPDFIRRWLSAFAVGWPVAATTAYLAFPLVRTATLRLVALIEGGQLSLCVASVIQLSRTVARPQNLIFCPEPFCCCEFASQSHDVGHAHREKLCRVHKHYGTAACEKLLQPPAFCYVVRRQL